MLKKGKTLDLGHYVKKNHDRVVGNRESLVTITKENRDFK